MTAQTRIRYQLRYASAREFRPTRYSTYRSWSVTTRPPAPRSVVPPPVDGRRRAADRPRGRLTRPLRHCKHDLRQLALGSEQAAGRRVSHQLSAAVGVPQHTGHTEIERFDRCPRDTLGERRQHHRVGSRDERIRIRDMAVHHDRAGHAALLDFPRQRTGERPTADDIGGDIDSATAQRVNGCHEIAGPLARAQ